jgi:hypothetical protein
MARKAKSWCNHATWHADYCSNAAILRLVSDRRESERGPDAPKFDNKIDK